MYENIKIQELLDRLDVMTVEKIHHKYSSINSEQRPARYVLKKFDDQTLSMLYEEGLRINYGCLTVLVAEALIAHDKDYRRYYNTFHESPNTNVIQTIVVRKLQEAFNQHQLIMGSNLINVLGFTFLDKCIGHDYLLARYGHELSRGLIFMGPEDWFKESLKNSPRIPQVAYETPWARALLFD